MPDGLTGCRNEEQYNPDVGLAKALLGFVFGRKKVCYIHRLTVSGFDWVQCRCGFEALWYHPPDRHCLLQTGGSGCIYNHSRRFPVDWHTSAELRLRVVDQKHYERG